MADPDARFEDPAFGVLSGEEAGDMWRMLTGRAEDLRVELAGHSAEGDSGSAHWIATYTFTQTGRPVVNDVRAKFKFRDGLIASEHIYWDQASLLVQLGLLAGAESLPVLGVAQTRAYTDPSYALNELIERAPST